MRRRLVAGSVMTILYLCLVGVAAAQCQLLGFAQVPPNTGFAVGPTMYQAALTIPGVAQAVLAARDAWDVTDAVNRIGDWNGVVTASDCPAGQPSQIGAFNFFTVSCETVTRYEAFDLLAFVDYFPSSFFAPPCPQCGTKSIAINLAYVYALNPQPGQYDIQSVLAHEFGHRLGLAHQVGSACTQADPPTCASDPARNTMGKRVYPGETCLRNLSVDDVASANGAY